MSKIQRAEAAVLKATMARYAEWCKEYSAGLRPESEGGVLGNLARAQILACEKLAALLAVNRSSTRRRAKWNPLPGEGLRRDEGFYNAEKRLQTVFSRALAHVEQCAKCKAETLPMTTCEEGRRLFAIFNERKARA